jgi:hypothetical protein
MADLHDKSIKINCSETFFKTNSKFYIALCDSTKIDLKIVKKFTFNYMIANKVKDAVYMT